jgi:hypothetical protein
VTDGARLARDLVEMARLNPDVDVSVLFRGRSAAG